MLVQESATNKAPILFEECYAHAESQQFIDRVRSSSSIIEEHNGPEGAHLIVLAHGFQGNQNDLRGFKNQISVLFPTALFLLSCANEGRTDGDIMEMGERLAQEVRKYI